MSVKTLAHWVADAQTTAPAPSSRHRNVGVGNAELSQLRAENATLRMERGILASYIHGFYNPPCLHSSLRYLSPDDFAETLTLRNGSNALRTTS